MPTTYGNDIVYCLKSHCGVRGYCRQKWVLQVQIICKFSNERTCKRNKDVQGLSCGFEDEKKRIDGIRDDSQGRETGLFETIVRNILCRASVNDM